MKFSLPYVLAILDALPVMVLIFLLWQSGNSMMWPALLTAAIMFGWHFTENSILHSRFNNNRQVGYTGYMQWVHMGFTAIILTAFVDQCMYIFKLPVIVALVGCLIAGIGIVLRIWAWLTLKEEFSKAPGLNQKYIRRGPYKFTDHPANIGFFLIGIGVAMGLGSAMACLTAIIMLLPALLYISRHEKKLLRTTFRL
jgi:isoprenylcysteine carboxyl methyltransferase (ICMT) family protein YpbQ